MSEKRGFFGKFLMVVGALALIALAVGGYFFWTASGWVDEFTATRAAPMPRVRRAAPLRSSYRRAARKINRFAKALKNQKKAKPLRLTARQLNALIQRSPQLRGNLQLFMRNNQLMGHFRIPLQGVPQLKGRYFNGTARIVLGVKGGKLNARIVDAKAKGKPLPAMMVGLINQFGKREINKRLNEDPQARRWVQRIRSVYVKGNRVVIVPR